MSWAGPAAFALAALPALLFLLNLPFFGRPRRRAQGRPAVSVLIPARNEESSIAAAVESALASEDVELEVIVLDDGSTDRTAAVVAAIADRDARVRLASGGATPEGWCGKQHACWQLAELARFELLCFLDADVRLAPEALSRACAWLERRDAGLVSGFPRQITETLGEKLLIPLIHFVLLGFLPMAGARLTRMPGFGAGCGQWMLARADAYRAAGGHAAIRESLHDGVRLPRAFRKAGFRTDAFDATELAVCRMYRTGREVWNGLAKNATEGMAAFPAILVFTALLAGGQLLPWFLLAADATRGWALGAIGLGYACRFGAAWRFRQSLVGALLHPVGVVALLALQWYARVQKWRGRPVVWKERTYAAPAASN